MSLVAQAFLLILFSVCYGQDFMKYKVPTLPPLVSCGTNMICVVPEDCIDGVVDDGGISFMGPRLLNSCPGNQICCNMSLMSTTTQTPTENTTQTTIQTATVANGCGYRNERGVTGQLNGDPSQSDFGEFPWMLQLMKNTDYLGGASLIHRRIALTVAHMVDTQNVRELFVRAGDWDIVKTTEPLPHEDRQVSEKIIHADYNNENLHFDIALLVLQSPFDLKPHINTVCLPPPNYIFNEITCLFTGWGEIRKEDKYTLPDILKKVSLKLVKKNRCQQMLRRTPLSIFFKLHRTFMCAGGETEDACFNDGGSPLVCPIEGRSGQYYQVGIVSWGLESCNKLNIPGVYTNIPNLRNWVNQKLAEKGIDSSSYTPL